MHPILSKTFGGLSKQYYFRQIFFGVLIALILIIIPLSQPKHIIQRSIFAIFIAPIGLAYLYYHHSKSAY